MSPESHCFVLERTTLRSPVELLSVEEILRAEGLNGMVIIAVLDAFRALQARAEEAEAKLEAR
jgi:hypothetical protein